MPDSVPDKDQVETFTPAMYSTHYCASPSLQRSKLDPYHVLHPWGFSCHAG